MRILFMGTDLLAVRTLARIAASPKHSVKVATTPPPETRSRIVVRHPVRDFIAQHQQIEVFQAPPTNTDWDALARSMGPMDLVVAASFGHLIPSNFLTHFPRGGIVLHPSLVPRHRGAAPLHHTILKGDDKGGVSVITIADKFDMGDVLHRVEVDVPKTINRIQLTEQLSEIGAEAVMHTLDNFDTLARAAVPQASFGMAPTRAPKVKKEQSYISWGKLAAVQVDRLHRALGDQFPLKATLGGKPVHIIDIAPYFSERPRPDLPTAAEPGTAVYSKKSKTIFIKCSDDWIECLSFRFPTEKDMAAMAFANKFKMMTEPAHFGDFVDVAPSS